MAGTNTSVKLRPSELKLVVRAVRNLEEKLAKQASDAFVAKKFGAETRARNEMCLINHIYRQLGLTHVENQSEERLSQTSLEIAAAEAHQAAFGSLDAYNRPERQGTRAELSRLRRRDLLGRIIPIPMDYYYGDKNSEFSIGYGVIKLGPTEPKLKFCHAIQTNRFNEVMRASDWFSMTEIRLAYNAISVWQHERELIDKSDIQSFDFCI